MHLGRVFALQDGFQSEQNVLIVCEMCGCMMPRQYYIDSQTRTRMCRTCKNTYITSSKAANQLETVQSPLSPFSVLARAPCVASLSSALSSRRSTIASLLYVFDYASTQPPTNAECLICLSSDSVNVISSNLTTLLVSEQGFGMQRPFGVCTLLLLPW